jgi:hypothetical protein
LIVPFVDPVGVVIAEDATVILSRDMRQKKSQVVFHDLVFRVDPNLFPKYANASGAPKPSDIIGILTESFLSPHYDPTPDDASDATPASSCTRAFGPLRLIDAFLSIIRSCG